MLKEQQLKEAKPNSLIGLSLSKCVSDIARKLVPEDAVCTIIASTAIRDDAGWNRMVATYTKEASSWSFNKKLCVAIANRLRQAKKIEQPLLTNPRYKADTSDGFWKTA